MNPHDELQSLIDLFPDHVREQVGVIWNRTAERVDARYPLIMTTARMLSRYNVGAQTRRTANNRCHDEDRVEIHPHDAEERGISDGDWVGIASTAKMSRSTGLDFSRPHKAFLITMQQASPICARRSRRSRRS